MIRVLHVVINLHIGGLERFVIGLINNFSPEVQSYVVCLEEKGELEFFCHPCQIYALHKKPGISMLIIKQLYTLSKECNIDLIHTHNPIPHFYGALSGFLAGIPVVNTKHGRNYVDHMKETRKVWLNRISTLFTRKIVAVSQNAAEVSLAVEKISSTKVQVIHNGIDTTLYRPSSDEFRSDSRIKIAVVARLSSEKDHLTLLKAAKILAADGADFHLAVIGDGSLRYELEQTVINFALERYVSFSGMRYDIPAMLQEMDIFVLSSTTEGLSMTLLEATASGLPIVATDVGGNPEVVVDGVTGYLVPPGNPVSMADKLHMLINNKELRKRMGNAGRCRAVEYFDIRQTAQSYESLYFDLLH